MPTIKCPHCHNSFFLGPALTSNIPVTYNALHRTELGGDPDGIWAIDGIKCPSCDRLIIYLGHKPPEQPLSASRRVLIRPKVANRPPIPPEVPDDYKADYLEACLVLADSPKASAALSRRSLQFILREKMQIAGKTLFEEIDQAVNQASLPSARNRSVASSSQVGQYRRSPNQSPDYRRDSRR